MMAFGFGTFGSATLGETRTLHTHAIPMYELLCVHYSCQVSSVVTSLGILSFLFLLLFLPFGNAGNVFVNYHSSDRLAVVCRWLVCLSVTFTYPLCFAPLRQSAAALCNVDKTSTAAMRRLTSALLAVITGLAMVCTSLVEMNEGG